MSDPSNSNSIVEDDQTTAWDFDISIPRGVSEGAALSITSNNSITFVADASRRRALDEIETEWELDLAIAKETSGGFSEGSTLSITNSSITPVGDSSMYPVDAEGGDTIES
jgi:hypothetical protein